MLPLQHIMTCECCGVLQALAQLTLLTSLCIISRATAKDWRTHEDGLVTAGASDISPLSRLIKLQKLELEGQNKLTALPPDITALRRCDSPVCSDAAVFCCHCC